MKNYPFVDKILRRVTGQGEEEDIHRRILKMKMQSIQNLKDINEKKEKNDESNANLIKKQNIMSNKTILINLEKKLNERIVQSNDKTTFQQATKQSTENNEQKIPTEDAEEKSEVSEQKSTNVKKKLKLCKQWFKTKYCKNGSECQYAHSKKELISKYYPDEWVNLFKFTSTQTNLGLSLQKRAFSSQSIRKPLYQDPKIMKEKMIQKATRLETYSVDKVIDNKGRTLLIETVLQNNVTAVSKLLMLGANPQIMDWSGNDSIMYAIKHQFHEVFSQLLDFSQVKLNLDQRYFTTNTTYLIKTAQMGECNIIISLLNAGADPNIVDHLDRSALFYCIERNDIDGIYSLIESGAKVNLVDAYNKTCVDYAFEKKNSHLILYLFQKGGTLADNTKHKQILFFAIENNMLELINEMLRIGIPLTECDEEGNNVLILAFKNKHYDEVVTLIEEQNLQGIISQRNQLGDNLLLLSIKNNIYNLSQYLIKKISQDLDYQDKDGKTVLIYAAELGQHEIVEQLMETKIDVNKIDKRGRTALIYAAKNNNLLCVEVLTKYGKQKQLNVRWKDQYDKTARNYAASSSIRALINDFMIESKNISDSLREEMDQEENKIDLFYKTDKQNQEIAKNKPSLRNSIKFRKIEKQKGSNIFKQNNK